MPKEPELNYIDFCGVMILSKMFKVSHVCKYLAEPKHQRLKSSIIYVSQAFRSTNLSLQLTSCKQTYTLATLCYFLLMKVAEKVIVWFVAI